MANLASQPQWPMDDEGRNELGNLILLLRRFLEEPPVLLRLQCHAVQRQQKDITDEMNLRAEMKLRGCTMCGTAGGVGPQVAAIGGCSSSTPEWLFKFGS